MEKRQERYRIGLIVCNVEDVFSNQVCKGAMEAEFLIVLMGYR